MKNHLPKVDFFMNIFDDIGAKQMSDHNQKDDLKK